MGGLSVVTQPLGSALLPTLPASAVTVLPIGEGVRTRSGLRFVDFREGSGPTPKFGQLLRFHYVAYAPDSDKNTLNSFDSSYDRRAAYLVKHGNGFTCQGIEEALHTMRVGGRRRVVMPAVLGFTADKGPLPPDSGSRSKLYNAVLAGKSLVFDLELVSIMDDLLDRGDYEDSAWFGLNEPTTCMSADVASCKLIDQPLDSVVPFRRIWTTWRRAYGRHLPSQVRRRSTGKAAVAREIATSTPRMH